MLLVAITRVFIGTYGTVFGNATPFVVLVGGIAPAGEAVGGVIRKFFFLVIKTILMMPLDVCNKRLLPPKRQASV